MSDPKVNFELSISSVDTELAGKDPKYLRSLCRNEVELFDRYLRDYGDEYRDGLAKFEKLAIEGYLYQKVKGRIDAKADTGLVSDWREDGTP